MYNSRYIDGLRSFSNFYSPTIIKKIIEENSLDILKSRFEKYNKIVFSSCKSIQFKILLSKIYNEMFKNYRNEYIYKNAIINKLLLGKYSINTTTLLNEFKIGNSVADTILINGEVKLFEIKTDLDNLARLDQQLEDYRKSVEKIYIVTNSRYIDKIFQHYVDLKYGLIELTHKKTLRILKEAESDKSSFDHVTIFKMLRKKEYLTIVKDYFSYIPDVPNTKIYKECLNKLKNINIVEFQKRAFNQIKQRQVLCPDYLKSAQTPYELKYLCYTLDLNKCQYEKLFTMLENKI